MDDYALNTKAAKYLRLYNCILKKKLTSFNIKGQDHCEYAL